EEPVAEAAVGEGAESAAAEVVLLPARIAELEAAEEFLLTVTDGGFGKRSSAYDYRVTGRGGQGIANITLGTRTGSAVVATFPVRMGDDVMLVTDGGRLIRTPGEQVRITGRQAQGVMLVRLGEGEHVGSVFPVLDDTAGDATSDDTPPDDEQPGPEPDPERAE
ncbi:MAG: DNA gyrase C-terminal beta-propeller domain-containing protein, partial [Acetobacteraceae bacterium]